VVAAAVEFIAVLLAVLVVAEQLLLPIKMLLKEVLAEL
jgi:hypothetical protein